MKELIAKLPSNVITAVITAVAISFVVQIGDWASGGAIVKMLGGATTEDVEKLATKDDLRQLAERLDADDVKILTLIDALTGPIEPEN